VQFVADRLVVALVAVSVDSPRHRAEVGRERHDARTAVVFDDVKPAIRRALESLAICGTTDARRHVRRDHVGVDRELAVPSVAHVSSLRVVNSPHSVMVWGSWIAHRSLGQWQVRSGYASENSTVAASV
jgi:hypothetical protein